VWRINKYQWRISVAYQSWLAAAGLSVTAHAPAALAAGWPLVGVGVAHRSIDIFGANMKCGAANTVKCSAAIIQ